MSLTAVNDEQRRARQHHARLLIDVSADPKDAARFDLPPAGTGLELQQQVVAALAALPFLAGAEVSVQARHECAPPTPAPPPAPRPEQVPADPDDFPRLRARVFAEAADALAWVWRDDTAKEQVKFLRDLAHRAGLEPHDSRLDPAWDRDGTRRQQFVEFLAVADPEQLRQMALDLVDQNVALRRAASDSESRASASDLSVQMLTAALARAKA